MESRGYREIGRSSWTGPLTSAYNAKQATNHARIIGANAVIKMKPIFICFLFFYLWNLSAQQIVVVDETNSEPITGVAVFNLFKTKTDISDFDGKVSLVRFQSFERVYFQHISYHKESMLKSKVSDTIFLSQNLLT